MRNRVVAVIIKNNKVLFVRGKGYSELWTPGGKIEKGETERQTLKRELKEELGLKLISMKFFKEYFMKSPYNNEMTRTKCYISKVSGVPKANNEIDSIIWYSKDDFLGKKFEMIKENENGLIPDLITKGLLK